MAEQRNIPTEIHCFTDPFSEDFTQITKECIIPTSSNEIIKGIASMDRIAMVTVQSDAMISLPGSAAHIFNLMGENNINIIFISQSSSENNITFGTNPENGFKAGQVLAQDKFFGKEWFKVIVDHDAGLISVVGAGMVHKPGIAGLLFTTLGNNSINIRAIAQGSSETNITMVIAADQIGTAVNVIYNAFINGFLPESPKINQW
jgi:aspartokinase/homoserine dehydrogenase 1